MEKIKWIPKNEPFEVLETITPEVAKEYLAKSKGNRRINKGRVNEYAEYMAQGKFVLNNDCICFDEDGTLVNGHHRLWACIQSGASFEAFVKRNMPKDAVYDRGYNRTMGDAMYMAGKIAKEHSSNSYSGVANEYVRITRGFNKKVGVEEQNFLIANEDLIEKVIDISRAGAGSNALGSKACIQAAILAALKCGVNEGTIREFMETVNTGFGDENRQSTALLLRNFMVKNPFKQAENYKSKLCAYTQVALRDYVAGVTRSRGYWYRTPSYPYMPGAEYKPSKKA